MKLIPFVLSALALAACGDDEPTDEMEAFSLRFAPYYGSTALRCGESVTGVGPGGTVSLQPSDLRFYVSNLLLLGESGEVIESVLDTNDFQYRDTTGEVALVDLTDTSAGACAGTGLSFPEGTARMHDAITGKTHLAEVHQVRFDVGLSQPLMKAVLAQHTAEDAPSPLREMHWSWAYAYRHFVFNFSLTDGGVVGEGYIHVGSTDCGGDGVRGLTDRATCGHVNTPQVALTELHLPAGSIAVDVEPLLEGLDFRVTQTATSTDMVPGVACHSGADQPDCAQVFGRLGVDMATGSAQASTNVVFKAR